MREIIIAGINRVADLYRDSLSIRQELNSRSTCNFRMIGDAPTEGEEVIIEDGITGRLFGGIIINVALVEQVQDINIWQIDCDDYTYQLDRRLVVEAYEDMPADEIFLDLVGKYCPGFATDGVQLRAPIVESTGAEFEYKRPSECFRWLCDYVGWSWYVDKYKVLHFFNPQDPNMREEAPMVLKPGGQFVFGKHSLDTQGLRNRVYVRGGTMLSDPQTLKWKADGEERIWVLPWGPHEISLKVGEVAKTVGIENMHEEQDFDYMMSFTEKYIRCSEHTATPVEGITMQLTARQDIPVITMVEDYASQSAVRAAQGGDGVYEHVISDDTLTSITAAEAAGMADLREHANPRVKGSFETEYTKPIKVERERVANDNLSTGTLHQTTTDNGGLTLAQHQVPGKEPTNLTYVDDLSTGEHDGVEVGAGGMGLGFRQRDMGKAIYVASKGNYVDLGNSTELDIAIGDFAIEVWVKHLDDYTNYFDILGKMNYSGDNKNGFSLSEASEGKPLLFLGDGGGHLYCNTALDKNIWYHIAYVRQNGILTAYVNGMQEASKDVLVSTASSNPLMIAREGITMTMVLIWENEEEQY